ncbi:MAG: putative hydro-lyase [Bacillota bacterium]
MLSFEQAAGLAPTDLRTEIARGNWRGPTGGMGSGYVQANLVVLPEALALAFLSFCGRNPGPCPVLEVTEPGSPFLAQIADADIRREIPRYRVYREGAVVDEPISIEQYWRSDLVAFLLGCSLTFEDDLLKALVPVRHLAAGRTVPMYESNIECREAGPFRGNMVVTMRPIPGHLVSRAVLVTARFPLAHGAPVHVGDPAAIGIEDLSVVSFGDPPVLEPGDVPVFHPCGVTPQVVAMRSRPELMISHYPGHMLVCDIESRALMAP